MMTRRHAIAATMAIVFTLLVSNRTDVVGQESAPAWTPEVELVLNLSEQSLKLHEAGRQKEALPLAEQALAIAERVWSKNQYNNHENLATVTTNLADLHKDLGPVSGDLARAERLYHDALKIYTRLGLENLEVSRTLNNLAGFYRAKGDYLAAEPLYERALKIRAENLGPAHRLVADSLDNLGLLYADRGDYLRAIKNHERALAIYRKEPGAEKDLAISLRNLALACTEIGDLQRAEALFREALQTERIIRSLSPGMLNGLGRVLRRKGELDAAESVYLDALALLEREPVVVTFELATTLNNLGVLYSSRGDYALAKPRYTRALEITSQLLGAEHPFVASMLSNLALLYEAEGRTAEALTSRERASEIRERNLLL